LVSNFPVQLAVVALLVAIVEGLLRAPIGFAVAVLAVVLNAVVVAPTFTADPYPVAPHAARLTIGHLNAQTRGVDADALGRYLTAGAFDVFVVLDPLQSDVARIAHAAPGYRVRTTGSRPGPASDFVRTVVLSRIPVADVAHPPDLGLGPSAVSFTIPNGDGPIQALIIGTDSPTSPTRARARDRTLDAAARWSTHQTPRRIVMGDFNATPWSPAFHHLLTAGRLDNSLRGFGLQVSWPTATFLVRIPIDHAVLGSGLAAVDRGTGPDFGSQHRALRVIVATRA